MIMFPHKSCPEHRLYRSPLSLSLSVFFALLVLLSPSPSSGNLQQHHNQQQQQPRRPNYVDLQGNRLPVVKEPHVTCDPYVRPAHIDRTWPHTKLKDGGVIQLVSFGGVGTSDALRTLEEIPQCSSYMGSHEANANYLKHAAAPYATGPRLAVYAYNDPVKAVVSLFRRGYLQMQSQRLTSISCDTGVDDFFEFTSVDRKKLLRSYLRDGIDSFRFSEHVAAYLLAEVPYPLAIINSHELGPDLFIPLCDIGLRNSTAETLLATLKQELDNVYTLARPMYGPLHCFLSNLPAVLVMPMKGRTDAVAVKFRDSVRRLTSAMLFLETALHPRDRQPRQRYNERRFKSEFFRAFDPQKTAERVVEDPSHLYNLKLRRISFALGFSKLPNMGDIIPAPTFTTIERARLSFMEELQYLWKSEFAHLRGHPMGAFCDSQCAESCRKTLGDYYEELMSNSPKATPIERLWNERAGKGLPIHYSVSNFTGTRRRRHPFGL